MTLKTVSEDFAQKFPFLIVRETGLETKGQSDRLMLLERSLRFSALLGLAHMAGTRKTSDAIAEILDRTLDEFGLEASLDIHTALLSEVPEVLPEAYGLVLKNPSQIRLFADNLRTLLDRIRNYDRDDAEALRAASGDFFSFLSRHLHACLVRIEGGDNSELVTKDVASGEVLDLHASLTDKSDPGLYLMDDYAAQLVPLTPFFETRGPELLTFTGIVAEGLAYETSGGEVHTKNHKTGLVRAAEVFVQMDACGAALLLLDRAGESVLPGREKLTLYRYAKACLAGREAAGKDSAKALEHFEKAMALDDSCPALYYRLAETHRALGDEPKALHMLEALVERFEGQARALETLGDAFAKKDERRALYFYRLAAKEIPYRKDLAQKRDRLQSALPKTDPPQSKKSKPRVSDSKPVEGVPMGELLTDMIEEARKGRYRPVVGREAEHLQLIEILSCSSKNNALLVGDTGVGKTALVEDLALRMARGRVPARLKPLRLLSFNVSVAIAGAKFRGQFEERILQVLKALQDPRAILFIDDFQTVAGSGVSRGGSLDLGSMIKPSLLRSDFQSIAAAPYEDYRTRLEKDPLLARCYQVLKLNAPDAKETLDILEDHKPVLEKYHRVRFEDSLFETTLDAVEICLREKAFPDKALEVYDRAAAKAATARRGSGAGKVRIPQVRSDDVFNAISDISQVPYNKVAAVKENRYRELENLLSTRIIGQPRAIKAVSRALRTAKLHFSLNPKRPEGIFLFLGPTGVGKTEFARALAEVLYGSPDKMIRIDMSEYMERISSSRLIGTSPGYVGYNDPNMLTDKVRKNPYSLILLDEIEKADAQLMNIFLQVFDAGRLTDGKGRTVFFNHTSIVMTGNIGTELYSRMKIGYEEGDGFQSSEASVMKEVKKFFSPEFLNRIDEVVLFDPLSESGIQQIVKLKLRQLVDRLERENKTLDIASEVYEHLALEGYSYEFGARHLERTIRRLLLDPIAEKSLEPEWPGLQTIRVTVSEGKIHVGGEKAPTPEPVVSEAEPSEIARELRSEE